MRRIMIVAAILALSSMSCASDDPSACGPAVREALDPSSLVHVLPGKVPPSYLTDPPTSGAHQPTPKISGAQNDPIAPQIQVGILEQGGVIVQYQGLSADDEKAITALASEDVVTAPSTDLPESTPIVATAWVTKMSCAAPDIDAIEHFTRTRSGKGPGHP